jgi:glycerol-3-phosphate dehydrogenase (NAD(P)+)
MEAKDNRIAVVGAGSWGTAIAFLLGSKGYHVKLWVYEPELVEILLRNRENTFYLPGVRLPETIHPSHSLEEVLSDSQFIVWVTPSHTIRETLTNAKAFIQPGSLFIGASKGIENSTLMRVSEIVTDVLGEKSAIRYVTLSGPTFAREVVQYHPTTAVIAGLDESAAEHAQYTLNTSVFRVYRNPDHVGVELGGALKNVIAIAAGITTGLKLGSNSRAALITRGLWEIARLGHAMGADSLTFLGLAGMGDLVLTCDGTQSRNFQVGQRIGSGETLEQIQASMRMVAEGVRTTKSARQLAHKCNVEMPITEKVYEVLYQNKSPKEALKELMTRSLKAEHQMDYFGHDESGSAHK